MPLLFLQSCDKVNSINKPLHLPQTPIYRVEGFTMPFEEICRENYARIYNYILAKTGKKEAAEDITQDVFLIAFQKGDKFLCHEKPIAFLYTTAKNLVLEYYKKSRTNEVELLESEQAAFEKDAYEELCSMKSGNINEADYRNKKLIILLLLSRNYVWNYLRCPLQ